MKLLVTGSRTWPRPGAIPVMLNGSLLHVTARRDREGLVVVHGDAPSGADWYADQWCRQMADELMPVECQRYPALWAGPCDLSSGVCQVGHRKQRKDGGDYCPTAGFRRNARMLREGKPEMFLAFVDRPISQSKGTWDMVQRARAAGVPGYVIELTPAL